MEYYKQIEIRDFSVIQEKTRKFLESRSPVEIGFNLLGNDYINYCPEILTAFSDFDLKVKTIALYTTSSQHHSQVHIDNTRSLCRINIPILNCEGSKTEFFTGGKYALVFQGNGISYLQLKEDSSAVKVAEVEIIRPTVIRVHVPHRVHTNLNTVPRICMTVSTNIDPVFLIEQSTQ